MIEILLKKADKQIGQELWLEVVETLSQAYDLDNNNMEVLEKRADAYHKLDRLADAVNDYNSYLRINPDNEILKAKKDIVQTILKNSQLDIYGCTNTHLDPWN